MRALCIPLALIMLLALATPVDAQCGSDRTLNPCGPLPWSQLPLPLLRSPTPYTPRPTLVITVTTTPTAAWTPTPNPTFSTTTPGYTLDPGLLQTPAAGVEVLVNTLAPFSNLEIVDAQGTPSGIEQIAGEFGRQAGTFTGYARGLQALEIGSFGPVIPWGITALSFVLLVWLLTASLPIFIWLGNLVLKLIQAIADLIPF